MKLEPVANTRAAEILLVDDNDDDVYLTREAFGASKLRVNLQHVNNGEKCLQYLRRQGVYADARVPDLILLDLHMPVMDGFEVLAEIVKDDKLRHFPVVVLTTSYEAADIRKMYALRCSSYIAKPVDFGNFVSMIAQLADYWLAMVLVPGGGDTRES
ncbi:response regulator [Polaromonas sp.]|uniref:response regulator n=1 Tax=Polaromonas sp. TaxID=1869339 RepID=UPI003752E94A